MEENGKGLHNVCGSNTITKNKKICTCDELEYHKHYLWIDSKGNMKDKGAKLSVVEL